MKKTVIALIILALPLAAGFTEYGAHGGFMFPSGDSTDVYKGSPFLGAHILSHFPMFAIEASISYVFLGFDEDTLDPSGHMIPILAGIRSYSGSMFLGGGLELDLSSTEIASIDTSTTDFGAYVNAGTIIPTATMDIELTAKYHLIDFKFDKGWFSIGAGVYF